MSPTYTHLVMSGGGFASLSYMGALRYLEQEGLHRSIHHVAGASMGSVIAAAFALQIPMDVLAQRIIDLTQDDALTTIPYPNLLEWISRLGMEDNRKFTQVLRPEIDQHTFLTLSKKTGIHLVVCVTHMSTMMASYFSVDTTPHVLILDAVCASCAIPWVFRPVQIGSEYYVDGGVADNLPVKPFETVAPSSVLLLHTVLTPPSLHMENPFTSPVPYTIAVMTRCMCQVSGQSIFSQKYAHYLRFDKCPLSFMPFTLGAEALHLQVSTEDMDASIAYGYMCMYQHLQKQEEVVS